MGRRRVCFRACGHLPAGAPFQVASAPAAPGAVLRGRAASVCGSCFMCRLVSANSIEEKLLKNGTKDLIREVAAQGNDYSMAFLTQVPRPWASGGLPRGTGAWL